MAKNINDQEERPMPTEEEAQAARDDLSGANRLHNESLAVPWLVMLGIEPAKVIDQVVGTVLKTGGTRPAWQWEDEEQGTEFILMAWPKDSPARASVLMAGHKGENLRAIDAAPLLEGLANDMAVEEIHEWKSGGGATVAAVLEQNRKPMWFYDPLYERDKKDLTPGVTQPIMLSALAFSLQKALIDNLSITRGPDFERYAAAWLEANPGKTRIDVPPLQIPLTGRHLIFPGNSYGEYRIRGTVEKVEECKLERMEIKIIYMSFPFNEREPLLVPIYAPKSVLKDYEPKEKDEIDAYIWLEGHVADPESPESIEAAEGLSN